MSALAVSWLIGAMIPNLMPAQRPAPRASLACQEEMFALNWGDPPTAVGVASRPAMPTERALATGNRPHPATSGGRASNPSDRSRPGATTRPQSGDRPNRRPALGTDTYTSAGHSRGSGLGRYSPVAGHWL